MAKIALEKYVNDCVNNLKSVDESKVIQHIENVYKGARYNDLVVRVVWDVCKCKYPTYLHFSDDDWRNTCDDKVNSLYTKAFRIAYPTAWKRLQELK